MGKKQPHQPHQHINIKKVLADITPVIENVAMKNGVIPIEVNLLKEDNRWYLRIFIFSKDHPIGHDDCEKFTRSLDDFLDELVPVKFYLEVSSPGAERKIKSSLEYKLFTNKKIKLKIKEPLNEGEERVFEAKLLDFEDALGLKILRLYDNKEYVIKEDNIFSARLCLED